MRTLLQASAIVCLACALLHVFKKIMVHLEFAKMSRASELGCYEDNLIYKAADDFASGKRAEDITEMLEGSFQLDTRKINAALSIAAAHRGDADGGYDAFLCAINKVLGHEVYHSLRKVQG